MISISEYALDDPYLRIPREDRIALRQERKARLGLAKLAIAEMQPPEVVEVPALEEIPEPPEKRELPSPKKPWFHLVDVGDQRVLISDIIAACASHYGVTVGDILSSRRTAKVIRPRQVGYFLAKTLTLKSLPEIGRRFGGRDHTAALHGIRKIGRLRETDVQLESDLHAVAAMVGGSLA